MKLKQLFTDDNAVSPVIGVILMVAITVILAAVIGTFVLGLGENLQDTSPTASITFDQQGAAGESDNAVKISHDGGAALDPGEIDITYEDTDGDHNLVEEDVGSLDASNWATDDEITAGNAITVTEDDGDNSLDDGNIIKVVWTSDGGESSSVLGTHEVN